jgi:hypothetical protein
LQTQTTPAETVSVPVSAAAWGTKPLRGGCRELKRQILPD